ncbi:S9 family peptidase [Alteromonas sediminis]|uniref:S9 family peptidase n=1 Tax=Alteromonas sediminis TaxID=2259342 RepID=A0A3N5Y133_9ALTE|nr:prolyl oligopeptidase family serine peptidase [Alteromonas sediminis]RPJ67487.1 S9 family peptidase [Alteromonas sediminis]
MKQSLGLLTLIAGTTSLLMACTSTAKSVGDATSQIRAPIPVMQPDVSKIDSDKAITLEQIMADPEWLGRQPENPSWSLDGKHMVFQRKTQGSVLRDWYRISTDNNEQIVTIEDEARHLFDADERILSPDGNMLVWRYADSVFVKHRDASPLQIRKGGDYARLDWTTDKRLLAQSGNRIVVIDPKTGVEKTVLTWAFADKPQAVQPPEDYIAEEQIALIDYIAKSRADRQVRFDDQRALKKANSAYSDEPVYLPADHELIAANVSPALNYAVIVSRETMDFRDDSDIMPHYIQEDGRIAAVSVRQRVADAQPENHHVWLVNLATGELSEIGYQSLPGYNEDVLADVKRENAEAKGETYEVNRLPRPITLLRSWYWTEPSLKWHNNGQHVALMLEAWDNKDRWIATIDLEDKTFITQHRQSDEAWINYRFNRFEWFNNAPTLYFLSEHTGYSHLYIKPVNGEVTALTAGAYVVDNLTATNDDNFIYYVANKKHPGIYEVYRVNTQTIEHQALTDLNGLIDYELSPDEQTLLLTHSKVTQPPELFMASAVTSTPAKQLTDTVSDAFKSMPWSVPKIVAIPSSHTDAPIYSRVYLPEDYKQGEPRKAVVFNHGAGYLQNAHLGWSNYFREFMFHSMLVQQGYVVLDMDFRASAGYGRDWRTAIYRQMGTPEVQDLRDGVNWLVENANVDRERIGTYGGSYGGFLTFMALFNEPDLFQAGAALRPVSDWAHYNTPYTSNILNTPDVDPIAYERSSPIYFAEGLEKPLLMNAPMVDDNVFFVDVVRLVQRLIELEKTNFETAIYPVEPHGFVQPSSWLDEYRRIYKLFEDEL